MAIAELTILYNEFVQHTDTLVAEFESPLPTEPGQHALCTPIHSAGRLMQVVRLQHIWGSFCRELVTRSALGGDRTATGRLLNTVTGLTRIEDIPTIVGEDISGMGAPWHIPDFALRIATKLRVENIYEIKLGLSAVSPLNYIKGVRNFVVHPDDITRRTFQGVARRIGTGRLSPDELLLERQPGGATRFEGWAKDLQVLCWNAVQ